MERHAGSYKKDDKYINGMPEYNVEIKEHISVNTAIVICSIILIIISIVNFSIG